MSSEKTAAGESAAARLLVSWALGAQLRQGFCGHEALRVQRGRDDAAANAAFDTPMATRYTDPHGKAKRAADRRAR